jgi:type VI secretion system protein ImpJ
MQPQWLGPRLVVGLRGQPERELAAWMAGAVIGSRTVWTSLSERRVLGAARKRIDEAPELGLRSGAGYTLFAIEVNDSFIVADQPLVISNANETNASQRPQEMVLFVQG